MTQEDTDNINQIIDYFKKKQISAFIGSGFSKNANTKFKNWNELLYPLIDEMYEEEINIAKEKISQNTEKNESDIKLNKIRDRIIARQGTTNIPEEYITYKGRAVILVRIASLVFSLSKSTLRARPKAMKNTIFAKKIHLQGLKKDFQTYLKRHQLMHLLHSLLPLQRLLFQQ